LLLTADPRFVEINYFLGQSAARTDLDEADRRLQLAISWRTEWPAALFAAGDVAELAEDFDRAVNFYQRTLAIVPRNSDAQLGHLRALSYAGRSDAALAAADLLLASGRWHTGEALYWKAWNEAQLARNDAAWSDVHEASRLLMNADVAKLTGILAIRRGELRVANDELQKAHARDAADCDTDVLLGGVLLELREWKSAAPALVDAVTCLDAHDEELRRQIAELRSAAGRERSVARREQQIDANGELRTGA
jgi:tetratricopeptide (TPR) repeat protein